MTTEQLFPQLLMDHQNAVVRKTAFCACVKLHAKNTAKNHANNTMQHMLQQYMQRAEASKGFHISKMLQGL